VNTTTDIASITRSITHSNIAMMWKRYYWAARDIERLGGADAAQLKANIRSIGFDLSKDELVRARDRAALLERDLFDTGRRTAKREMATSAASLLYCAVDDVIREING